MADKKSTRQSRDNVTSDQVYECAKFGMTYEEMQRYFKCSLAFLQENFLEEIQAGHAEMKMSLRRKRLAIALNDQHPKQAAMLIFLSKVVLGEKEYQVVDNGLTATEHRKNNRIEIAFINPDGDVQSVKQVDLNQRVDESAD